MAVFKSPLKGVITSKLKARNGGANVPTGKSANVSANGADKPVPFGIPDEDSVRKDVDEAIHEYRELKARRRRSLDQAHANGLKH